jgi:hypothetical protein
MLKGEDLNLDKIGADDAMPNISALQREVLVDQIANRGSKPDAAAREADIGLKNFRKWRNENESFGLFIEELELAFHNRLRKRVADAIDHLADKDNDAAQVADKAMKFLERIDPEFGTKHTSIAVTDKTSLPNINTTDDADIQKVMREAQEAANAGPTGG